MCSFLIWQVAHTCFFSIELQRYTSPEKCYSKLLYACSNCQAIDADNTTEGRANAEMNSAELHDEADD